MHRPCLVASVAKTCSRTSSKPQSWNLFNTVPYSGLFKTAEQGSQSTVLSSSEPLSANLRDLCG